MLKPRMLEGYRVLDLTQYAAGPYCTQLLGDMGAEVIKIEMAPGGDRMRSNGTQPSKSGYEKSSHSSYYLAFNRNKLSVAVDLKTEKGRALVTALVPRVDIIVENFSPGVMESLGWSYQNVKALNPTVIMLSSSAAGQTGELSDMKGYDFIGAAYAGVTNGIGEADGPPVMTAMAVGDIATAIASTMAIGIALLHRERTGEGQFIDSSLLDTYFQLNETTITETSLHGENSISGKRNGSLHSGSPLFGIYQCSDGRSLTITIAPHQWPAFTSLMGKPELIEEPRFKTFRDQQVNAKALADIVRQWLGSLKGRDEAVEILAAAGMPCAPVLTLSEVIRHPHLIERKTVRWIEDPIFGRVAVTGLPVKFSRWEVADQVRFARLGEDNQEVLTRLLGLSVNEVADLVRDGVLISDPTMTAATAKN